MKFLVAFLLTGLLVFASGIYLPWWSLALAAFLAALLVRQSPGKAWLAGFLGCFFTWMVLSWWINRHNQGILSAKIAVLLPLGGSAWALMAVTALVGGLVAGFAALSASLLLSLKRQR